MNAGDLVRVRRDGQEYEGIVLPSSTPERLVVKLEGGYNVGVDRADATVDVLESDAHAVEYVEDDGGADDATTAVEFDPELPTISLISTGGTIASTVDYRTGAVTARFDADDVLRAVPDLAGLANYRGRVVANMLSENMTPDVWEDLADAIVAEIEAGADGVVVMHGTDTMQFTASAMAFMLETPVPIVFTGSQRSADRPSSDNVMNAVSAVRAASADLAEVLVCMHASHSDDRCALHRATRVRKNHTSRRDAFETVGGQPMGFVDYESGTVSIDGTGVERGERELDRGPGLEPDVALLKFTPGMSVERLAALRDRAGIVIEGTGLGHVHSDWVQTVEEIIDEETPVVMTSQCLEGRVCDRVYDTGRDLIEAGVIEGETMLPGTAKVKLMWALGRIDIVTEGMAALAELMRTPVAGELTARSAPWAAQPEPRA